MPNDMSHITARMRYRVVIITLDSHSVAACELASSRLAGDFKGLSVEVFAAAEWGEQPDKLHAARQAIATADIVITNLLFLEDHITPILPDLEKRRVDCDAMIGVICDAALVKLTKMGTLDMSSPQSGTMKLLRKLRGSSKSNTESGERKMRMLRRLPKILKYIPGKAQDLRAWFLVMQYWLGGSAENVESMVRMLLSRYCHIAEWQGGIAKDPKIYPDVGLYHPDLADRITTDVKSLPNQHADRPTVGILLMRSYILGGDTAHYDHVINQFETAGVNVIAAFAGGLDGRPAISQYFQSETGATIDVLLSLTGFSLVGGPAYNDTDAAVAILKTLDRPYVAAHPLEFQTLAQWGASKTGLGPIENTMLVALPELDGATLPTVFAGRHDDSPCQGCAHQCHIPHSRAMHPCPERIERLVARVQNIARLQRQSVANRRIAIVLFGFPPNAGAAGTAAYLNVFASLFNTLSAMKSQGYAIDLPANVDELRAQVLGGNSTQYGQEANVADKVSADTIVQTTPWLDDIEQQWGAAPGRDQSDGRDVFVLGHNFGNVFVGLQPKFGYEGDPMRLLFEGGFAPTHAFSAFYQWIKHTFQADAVLHFGMHGALEFMPGKQTGPSNVDWPDRLIGDLPNIYLYAGNNPSEASLAKRRSNATIITHLTPPVVVAGLYKGLADLKDSLTQWRGLAPDDNRRDDLQHLIMDQAAALDFPTDDIATLWERVLETENALIPEGLHIVGAQKTPEQIQSYLDVMDVDAGQSTDDLRGHLTGNGEISGILRALDGRYIEPVVGGDLIRTTDILPTGRNIHAFDPFRMPSEFACRQGASQAAALLDRHDGLPRSVALVLWGSDNIKSDGTQLAQALALIGAKPRFDAFGRLSGADLIPLSELGRPRIDVIMTLSGIFRDLLPLQTKMLAQAALAAAQADEPEDMNFIRAHALAYANDMGVDIETAALRVFSNAEGAYGSNVNQLVDSSAFDNEDELADAYQSRKSFAYGVNGKARQNAALLTKALSNVDVAYQNLESVELGITTVDHYFDTLGGISRAVKRARNGTDPAVYISDHTRGTGRVRTLSEQLDLETRSRSLNPKFYESLLEHGSEGVRQIEAHLTNTVGWSATTGQVQPWVYQQISETFVLDQAMLERIAALNPVASSRMANRLLEASDRAYWSPSAETIAALQQAADQLEDQIEGIPAQ